jgi:hypothetical protein
MSESIEFESRIKAAEIMAKFWRNLLSQDTTQELISGWTGKGERNSSSANFSTEFVQAQASIGTPPKIFSIERLDQFEEELKDYILKHELDNVRMEYHPDDALRVASLNSGIDIGVTTFPIDTSTCYDTQYEEVLIYQGRGTKPEIIRVNPDEAEMYAYFAYQTEPDGPIKTLEVDKREVNNVDVEQLVSERENLPTYTINIAGQVFATSAEKAIQHMDKSGQSYAYDSPSNVSTKWLTRAKTAEHARFLVEERGADPNGKIYDQPILEHLAQHGGAVSVVQELISMGANASPELLERIETGDGISFGKFKMFWTGNNEDRQSTHLKPVP